MLTGNSHLETGIPERLEPGPTSFRMEIIIEGVGPQDHFIFSCGRRILGVKAVLVRPAAKRPRSQPGYVALGRKAQQFLDELFRARHSREKIPEPRCER